MAENKKIRFQVNNKWSKWYKFGEAKIPNEILSCEIVETVTLAEIKKDPHWYEIYKKQILN